MPPKQTFSGVMVIGLIAVILLLLFGIWHWTRRIDVTPKAPLHPQSYAPHGRDFSV